MSGSGAIRLVFMAVVGLLLIDIAVTGLLGSVIAAFIDPAALTDLTPGGGTPPPIIPVPPTGLLGPAGGAATPTGTTTKPTA